VGRSAKMAAVRIATWNVNSLNARLPRVEQWLSYVEADVVCLQETKLTDAAFPSMPFTSLGYESVHHGLGRWNGVAILSRIGIDDVTPGFAGEDPGEDEGRIVTATCGGLRVSSVYVPNGREVGSSHYEAKLDWLRRLRGHLDRANDRQAHVAVCGDFNIAPEDRDVWDPEVFTGATHVSAEERKALADIQSLGLVDAFRVRYHEDQLFSWWDYRRGDFHEHRGMRIDLVLVSSGLAPFVRFALIDRFARKGKQPSDHAPVLVDLDLPAPP
jgi:exodeoxyribonuclease III